MSTYQFEWNLDFASQNITFVPFYEKKYPNCLLCNFTPNNVLPNSSPYDVVLTIGYGRPRNVMPLIRTLRTTKTKASCVFIIERNSYSLFSNGMKKFIENCGVQVLTFDFPINNMRILYTKNYLYHLAELFLRSNQASIQRVAIVDLFDTIFQGDPFNEFLPKNEIHIVDEGAVLSGKGFVGNTNRRWIRAFDQNFIFTDEILDTKFWCTGYMEGPCNYMITFLNLFNQIVNSDPNSSDQGGFNYLNYTGKLQKAILPVAPPDKNERVRHASIFRLSEKFPYATAMYNTNLTATVLHHIYHSNDAFKISFLKACPRPDSTYQSYLPKCDEHCIKNIENKIANNIDE